MRTVNINLSNLDTTHKYWLAQHRLRHDIFIKRLGWPLNSYNNMEFDQFDHIAARYIVVVDDNDEVCAVSRLLPTSIPYMIETCWPDWLGQAPIKCNNVWEASRFGCADHLDSAQRRRAISLLLAAIYKEGQKHGVKELLMVMPSFIFNRIIRPEGYQVEYIGAERIIDKMRTRLARVPIFVPSITRILSNENELVNA